MEARLYTGVIEVCFGLGSAALSATLLGHVAKRNSAERAMGWGPLRRRRLVQVEQQLVGWLLTLTQILRANPSMASAMEASVCRLEQPLRGQLQTVVDDYRLGCPLGVALDRLAHRVNSPLTHSVVTLLKVARKSGGDAATTLERAAEALREQARLDGVLRSATAEGRIQALVIGSLPAVVGFGAEAMLPGYFEPMLGSLIGYSCIAVAGLLWAVAIVLTHKILAVQL